MKPTDYVEHFDALSALVGFLLFVATIVIERTKSKDVLLVEKQQDARTVTITNLSSEPLTADLVVEPFTLVDFEDESLRIEKVTSPNRKDFVSEDRLNFNIPLLNKGEVIVVGYSHPSIDSFGDEPFVNGRVKGFRLVVDPFRSARLDLFRGIQATLSAGALYVLMGYGLKKGGSWLALLFGGPVLLGSIGLFIYGCAKLAFIDSRRQARRSEAATRACFVPAIGLILSVGWFRGTLLKLWTEMTAPYASFVAEATSGKVIDRDTTLWRAMLILLLASAISLVTAVVGWLAGRKHRNRQPFRKEYPS